MQITQPDFFDAVIDESLKKGAKRRGSFLNTLDRLVPWTEIEKLVAPVYKPSGKRGQQPYPLSVMLRVHILQLAYNLSDPMAEETIFDSFSCRMFVGLTLTSSVPDETTILRFRHLIEKYNLAQPIFDLVNQKLAERGLLMSKGTIVDGSFISAPSSTKNKTKSRDPEMASGKKGNTWHFGMKVHIGVDKTTGIVHSLTTTPANVHDICETDKLRRESDNEVIGDSGYLGMEKRDTADPEHVTYQAAKRYSQRKKMSERGQAMQKRLTSVRCKVEHVFHRVKVQFGYRKTRYRGLAKNTSRLKTLAALANLFIADCYERRTEFTWA